MSSSFAVLLLGYILSQFYRAFLAVIASDLSRDLGLGPAALGNLSAIWFATFALAQFPVGVALDRIGPRRTMAFLFLVAVAGAGLFGLATTFAEAAFAMALIGIGCSPILMGAMYYFGRTAPPEKFALLGSMVVGFGSLGNLLGAAPLAYAAATVGWRASIVVIAVLTAISALAIYLVIKDPVRVKTVEGQSDGIFAGIAGIFSVRAILLMAPFALTGYASVAALRSLWVASYFGQVHGFDASERGHAALVMAIAMSLGALAYGPLERFFQGPKRAIVIGTSVAICALGGLSLLGSQTVAGSIALYAIFGFAGMSYAIVLAHARMFFPPHLLGRGVTAMNFLSIGGAGLLQWVSGMFVEHAIRSGWAPETIYSALHGLFALVLVTTLTLYLTVPARPAK